jgi:SAM-dependent methyltransferase
MTQNNNINIDQKKWWESDGGFFGDLYLEADNSLEGFLDKHQDLEERTRQEVEGVIRLCDLKHDNSILDCPCGYGRHSLKLAQMGYKVTGTDINDRFLSICNQLLKEKKLTNCRFVKKDMRFLDYSNEFDVVINMFYSFGFFDTEEENKKVLQNFYNALKPGGRFLMHTHITLPKILNGKYKRHEIRTLKSGNKLELFRDYDSKTKRENGQWFLLTKDGSKKASSTYSVRIYDKNEFIQMCSDVGFSQVKTYGDWNGGSYYDLSPLLIVVATK